MFILMYVKPVCLYQSVGLWKVELAPCPEPRTLPEASVGGTLKEFTTQQIPGGKEC